MKERNFTFQATFSLSLCRWILKSLLRNMGKDSLRTRGCFGDARIVIKWQTGDLHIFFFLNAPYWKEVFSYFPQKLSLGKQIHNIPDILLI